jgi:3-isopropylmalate/(R)-2-methylmalate dehydratase small subunit
VLAFTTHTGRVAILDWTDVNTDLIIPARYLKRIERTGYGPLLFADKRYVPGGAPEPDEPEQHGAVDPEFPLAADLDSGASILMTGSNFGCGSSREHAVWAVMQGGFRAVIAPGIGEGFADIFEGNALNNGLLPIELPPQTWREVALAVRSNPSGEMTIDLNEQSIIVKDSTGKEIRATFQIPEDQRRKLLGGIDSIGETLALASRSIDTHEAKIDAWRVPTAQA